MIQSDWWLRDRSAYSLIWEMQVQSPIMATCGIHGALVILCMVDGTKHASSVGGNVVRKFSWTLLRWMIRGVSKSWWDTQRIYNWDIAELRGLTPRLGPRGMTSVGTWIPCSAKKHPEGTLPFALGKYMTQGPMLLPMGTFCGRF